MDETKTDCGKAWLKYSKSREYEDEWEARREFEVFWDGWHACEVYFSKGGKRGK